MKNQLKFLYNLFLGSNPLNAKDISDPYKLRDKIEMTRMFYRKGILKRNDGEQICRFIIQYHKIDFNKKQNYVRAALKGFCK